MISCEASISFEQFMRECLYHPEHGYYAKGRRTGREGDFFTSVSVGSLFGELLAHRFAEIWNDLGKPEEFDLCEQGAEQGFLAQDILLALKEYFPDCYRACRYHIIEPFESNQNLQQELLKKENLLEKISWKKSLDEFPQNSLNGIFFSNELVDSFPVHQVVRKNEQWFENYVIWNDQKESYFLETKPIQSPELQKIADTLPPIEGYVAEISLEARKWMKQAAQIMNRGYVFTIDYGFEDFELYHPDRTCGTLVCYRNHQKSENPLLFPCEQDITSHVDFSALMKIGEENELKTSALLNQENFLIKIAEKIFKKNPQWDSKKRRSFQTLTHPQMMGKTFKVLIQNKVSDSKH